MSKAYKLNKYMMKLKNTDDDEKMEIYMRKIKEYKDVQSGGGWVDERNKAVGNLDNLNKILENLNKIEGSDKLMENYNKMKDALTNSFWVIKRINNVLTKNEDATKKMNTISEALKKFEGDIDKEMEQWYQDSEQLNTLPPMTGGRNMMYI
jgi:phosphoglycerate-specific signal transduction histidine kinase